MRRPWGLWCAVACAALLACGCGGGANGSSTATKVIKGWSDALRSGDVNGAASYFALPSVFADGPGPDGEPAVTVGNVADARIVNASLPCGAKLISAARSGHYFNALFRLTDRPGPGGSDCGSGAGQTARVDFEIVRGKIAAWIRVPLSPSAPPQLVNPGGPNSPGPSSPPPGTPGGTQNI